MIGLDTNILVRFLVQDDPTQAEAGCPLIDRYSVREPAFVGREALIEAVWVLDGAYGFTPDRVAPAILGLMEA